jgi:4-hydroxy-3-methylbut-2-enyl diphosphate reductase
VQTAEDIRPGWLAGARAVGVTAGASAPEALVEAVVARLRALAKGEVVVEAQAAEPEGVVFQLPPELRSEP